MKRTYTAPVLFLILLLLCAAATAQKPEITTIVMVRHAEKGDGDDPGLTDAGKQRAAGLVRLLQTVRLDAVYSTNTKRTMQTARPVAAKQGIEVTQYNPGRQAATAELMSTIQEKYKGGAVLVISHSNIIPVMIEILEGGNGSRQEAGMDAVGYDDIYIASVTTDGESKILRLKYGDASATDIH